MNGFFRKSFTDFLTNNSNKSYIKSFKDSLNISSGGFFRFFSADSSEISLRTPLKIPKRMSSVIFAEIFAENIDWFRSTIPVGNISGVPVEMLSDIFPWNFYKNFFIHFSRAFSRNIYRGLSISFSRYASRDSFKNTIRK